MTIIDGAIDNISHPTMLVTNIHAIQNCEFWKQLNADQTREMTRRFIVVNFMYPNELC